DCLVGADSYIGPPNCLEFVSSTELCVAFLYASNQANMRRIILIGISSLLLTACSNNDNSHTTATTYVAAPPHQVLTVVHKPGVIPKTSPPVDPSADQKQPLLVFHLDDGKTFRVGEEVPVEFSVMNAKLRGEGGEFRVRYITDDDEMQWLDTAASFSIAGWTPGKHKIRIELIGPDG
ncbi:MAG: hypothetical protein DMF69_12875, partial [Acidobacteria bacterium]